MLNEEPRLCSAPAVAAGLGRVGSARVGGVVQTTLRCAAWLCAWVALGLPAAGTATTPRGVPSCIPEYDPTITAPETAIPGWPDQPATTTEIEAYLLGIAAETDRVETVPFATSTNGRPLYYSLVGDPAIVAGAGAVAATQEELRDPRVTDAARAVDIAATEPAIAWYLGNVHGNETSGADAALRILYELAARTDCEAEAMRAELLVGVIASQNPDGRDVGSRDNAYGFDLNRDWLVQTQPETGDKLRVLERYPPVVLVDAHEMGGREFFFPPMADPVHHEISPQALHWMNDLYGAALAQTFDEGQLTQPGEWEYFNYEPYNLFAVIFGDTVPTLAFTAAGMTFEKGWNDPAGQRFVEHFAAGWTTLRTAAARKSQILQEYYDAHVEALAEGELGLLGENMVQDPASPPAVPVPQTTVRHYFLGAERASADAERLVARLRQHGVEVYRLREQARVRGLRSHGLGKKARKLKQGTYWIPMAQPQKRWVQSVLGEEAYPAVPVFYDVSAWSNPLLMNLDAWYTGEEAPDLAELGELVVDPPAPEPLVAAPFHWFSGDTARALGAALALAGDGLEVRRLPKKRKVKGQKLPAGTFAVAGEPARIQELVSGFGIVARGGNGNLPGDAFRVPKVGVFDQQGESYEHLRFFLDQVLRLAWTPLTAGDVEAGLLASDGFDVFVVPGVPTQPLEPAEAQLESWIDGGGVFIGSARIGRGGTPFAAERGWTTASTVFSDELDVPGTLFPVKLKRKSPLALGAGKQVWWFHLGERVLTRSKSGANAALFPKREKKLWFSGYAEGAEVLLGSAGLVDERLGEGRVVLFSGEPNFRAWTDGTQLLLANALVYPRDARARSGRDVRSAEFAGSVARARAAVAPPTGPGRPLRIRVPASDEGRARAVLAGFTSEVSVHRSGATVALEIPNPEGLPADVHPFSRLLLPGLAAAGVEVLYAAL